MGKIIKYSLVIIFYMCNMGILFAQTEPEPYWSYDRNKLKEGENFVYAVGRGQGKNRDEADKVALNRAIDDAKMQLRKLSIPESEIGDITKITAGKTNENIRFVCSCYFKVNNNDNTYQVYVLYRFRKDIYNKEWGDKNAHIDCGIAEFDKQREKYYKHFPKPKVPVKIKNDLYLNIGSGISYGTYGMSFGGRHGKLGYQVGFLGSGEKGKYWHYSGGLKFYPYKSFFLSANYGRIAVGQPQIQNTDDGQFSYRDNYVQWGWSFLIGADIWIGEIGALNIGIGTALNNGEWKFPVFDVGIGLVHHF